MSSLVVPLRRTLRLAGAVAAMTPKVYLAYSIWVWMDFFVNILSLLIFTYFWRAIYASSPSAAISGLTLTQTLGYILLARILQPVMESGMIFRLGYGIREGMVAIELLRPADFQFRSYLEALTGSMIVLLLRLPLLLLAILFLGLQPPADPRAWAAAGIAILLGHAISFCFDWLYACLAFYTTEVWGLAVVREAVALFFSGALIPLAMLPGWLQQLSLSLPFAQVIYVPVALLSGILPPEQAPSLWLIQLLWLAGLLLASRLFFNFAVRKITIQGG